MLEYTLDWETPTKLKNNIIKLLNLTKRLFKLILIFSQLTMVLAFYAQ